MEIIEGRRDRKVKRMVLSSLAAFLVLLAGWYGQATFQTWSARTDLSSAEDEAQALRVQQHDFDKVVSAQAESKSINTQLSTLLASDLRWSTMLASLRAVAPSGVQVTGVSAMLTPPDEANAGAKGAIGSRLPSMSDEETIGAVTVTGTGQSKTAVAAYVDALGKVPGLANPLLSSVTLQEATLHFIVAVDITSSALSRRFAVDDKKAGEK